MSDQPFREIQLSGKQLGFLFMSAVALAVVIFLLGVSVGRGVRGAMVVAPPSDVAATDTTVPAALPPPTQTNPGDLTYHGNLQAGSAGKSAEPPAPAAEAPAPTAAKAEPPAPVDEKAGAGAPGAKPAPPTPTPEKEKTPPPTAGGWVVQAGNFGSKENADRLAARLKEKGFTAFVVSEGPANAKFRVKVGPFVARADADAAAARLKREEGGSPFVTR